MPSSVPLTNAIAQNTVDFNNQTPTNASGLFRYKINNYTGQGTFTDVDLNSVCIFNNVGNIVNVTLSSSGFSVVPPVGAEIIFYSLTGNIRLNTGGSAVLNYSVGNYTTQTAGAGKIIHKGNHVWYFASANASPQQYSWTNCCSESAELYQIATVPGFNSSLKSYTDSGAASPYNGTVYDGSLYYRIVNGVYVSTSPDCASTTLNYNTSYTFYDSPDPIYGTYVNLVSVAGLTESQPNTLIGYKFFTQAVGNQYDCYGPNTVNGAYYTNNNTPYYAVTFTNGYLTSYSYSP
jgi:hypothetical protein